MIANISNMNINKIKISKFAQRVYFLVKQIPAGRISTYSNIAIAMKNPRLRQAVGTALAKNPYPYNLNSDQNEESVPCHRVIASNGSIGGFFGKTDLNSKEIKRKINLLKNEGIDFIEGKLKGNNDYFKNIIFTDFKINLPQ